MAGLALRAVLLANKKSSLWYVGLGGRLTSLFKGVQTAAGMSWLDAAKRQSAAMVIGARTMMEGGAMGPFTREQIEAFCQERLIGKNLQRHA